MGEDPRTNVYMPWSWPMGSLHSAGIPGQEFLEIRPMAVWAIPIVG